MADLLLLVDLRKFDPDPCSGFGTPRGDDIRMKLWRGEGDGECPDDSLGGDSEFLGDADALGLGVEDGVRTFSVYRLLLLLLLLMMGTIEGMLFEFSTRNSDLGSFADVFVFALLLLSAAFCRRCCSSCSISDKRIASIIMS